MTWTKLHAVAERYGDAFFLYDEQRFRGNYESLLTTFRALYPRTEIGYSYKTNYTPDVCLAVKDAGGYAEVVSDMEYELARRLGVPGDRIIYNGPARSAASIERALGDGAIINLDSLRDLNIVENGVQGRAGDPIAIGLRLNFPFEFRDDSRFGFAWGGDDLAEALARVRRNGSIRLAGLHCHMPDRALHTFEERVVRLLEAADELFDQPPVYLNVGGGYFGAMPPALLERMGGAATTFEDYAGVIAGAMRRHYANAASTPTLFIEPGTSLVADAFQFVVRVLGVKDVRGRRIATVAGSMFNVSPYSRLRDLPVSVVRESDHGDVAADAEHGAVDVAGYTCIEGDFLSLALPGPVRPGDFLVYDNVGSYSVVMKPPFIMPGVPILAYDERLHTVAVVKEAETIDHVFATFPRFRGERHG